MQEPYAALTPARYRYFTVIKVTTQPTQVVNHCIVSGQTPQDAVGGQFDTVYKEMVTIGCSCKVLNVAMHSKCVRKKVIYLYYFTPIGSINCEN